MPPEAPDACRADRLEAVICDYLRAVDAGRPPDPLALLQAHPDLADDLRAFLDDQDAVGKQVRPIREALCEPPPADGLDGRAVPQVPGYERLRPLGAGGMGVVYRAWDPRARRDVAIKVIPAGHLAGPAERQRFLLEAQSAAGLNHPNIVRIYEVKPGEVGTAGEPYFSMEFMAGGSLADRVPALRRQPRDAAKLVHTVARAVDHAHRHGLIHRDLKPANILLAADGTPRVADFGLVKRTVADRESRPHEQPPGSNGQQADPNRDTSPYPPADAAPTQEGSRVGTPPYMAPEQARGEAGLTVAVDVYGLGAILYELLAGRPPFTGPEILAQVCGSDPAPPRKLNPKVPRDLEAICLKCLRKDPADRYPDAARLADDLDRFLNGEPVEARPVSRAVRLGMWARRQPLTALLVASVLLLAGTVVGGGLWEVVQVFQQRIKDREQLYEKGVALAEGRIATGQLDQAYEALDGCPLELRHWEWYYLWRLCQPRHVHLEGHQAPVRSVCWSPDWQRVLTAGQDGTARLWDAKTGKQLHCFTGHQGEVAACFACDGRFVLSAGREQEVRLWNADTGQLVRRLSGAGDLVACDTRSKWLATVGRNQQLRLFELAGGREVWKVAMTAEMVSLAMSPDGRYLAAGGYQRAVELRQVPSGKRVDLAAPPVEAVPWALAFSRREDRPRYLAAGLPRPVMWDVRSGQVARTFSGTGHLECASLDFSPDDDRLVGTSRDGLVRVWMVSSQLMVRGPARHDGMAAAFGRDGRWLAVTRGKTVTIEDLYRQVEPCRKLERHRRHDLEAVAFSPDGRWLASLAGSGEVLLWDAEADFRPTRLPGPAARGGLAFAEEGGRTWLCAGGDRLSRWAVDDPGKVIDEGGPARCLAVRAGRTPELAFSSGKGVTRRRLDNGSEETFTVAGGEITALAFRPSDGSLAVGDVYGVVRLCSAATGAVQRELRGRRSPVTALAFSGDGTLLATAAADLDVRLWDVRSGKEPRVLRGHDGTLTGLAFSPDGARLVSCASDGRIKVWDSRRGVELLTLDRCDHPVTAVAFDPSGERLASCGHDGVVRIWEGSGQR
jgi:WD40 repeat protein/serine/threonine protein kinase